MHVTTTRKHDAQIALQVVKRNAASIEVLTGDKGYDDQKLRRFSHDHNIRPLIKHWEFTPLHKAWNARLDSDLYHRRNMNETVNAAIKQKFGAFVRSRLWWKQFRELVIKCIVHNLERSLAISHEGGECPRFREERRPRYRGSMQRLASVGDTTISVDQSVRDVHPLHTIP